MKLVLTFLLVILLSSGTSKTDWRTYAKELQSEGWSVHASEHIAKVEFKVIPEDEEYISYIED